MLDLATPKRRAHWRELGALAYFTRGENPQAAALAGLQPAANQFEESLCQLAPGLARESRLPVPN